MDENLYMAIKIETSTRAEMHRVSESIHRQLKGNPDYVESNIVLNRSDSLGEEGNNVYVYVFKECERVPAITIE